MINNISLRERRQGRFALVGGFLGAGKTTLIGLMAQWLRDQGLEVALVTNDQGEGLLDTASAKEALGEGENWRAIGAVETVAGADELRGMSEGKVSSRLASNSRVAEIPGGCFCCRLDELVDAIEGLNRGDRPDVMIAEPVGSCTDLMATVLRPLEQIYHAPLTLAPLSVVLDARRSLAALGGRRSKRDFHRDVGSIYREQMEEAEWLGVNKSDLIDEEDLSDLLARLARDSEGKRVFVVSAKTGVGLEEWFRAVLHHETGGGQSMDVDYAR